MPTPVLLRFAPALIRGTLLRRYQRFLADVQLTDGRVVTAHCPDPGSMRTLAIPGRSVALSRSHNPARKLPYTWEMVDVNGTWVGIHTGRTNDLVGRALASGAIEALPTLGLEIRREVKVGASRLDFCLHDPSTPERPGCFVEVKTVTLRCGDRALFPDSVTTRGQKHLRELTALADAGTRAVLLFFVNRADCRDFGPADSIDPTYGRLLRDAVAAGVEVLAYRARLSPQQVRLDGSIGTVL